MGSVDDGYALKREGSRIVVSPCTWSHGGFSCGRKAGYVVKKGQKWMPSCEEHLKAFIAREVNVEGAASVTIETIKGE